MLATNLLCAQQTVTKNVNDTNACNVLIEKIENEQDEQIWILYNKELQTICLNQLTQPNLAATLQRSYQKFYATSLANEAFYNDYAGNIKKALELNFKALSIYEKLNLPYETSVTYNNIGYLYDELSDWNSALKFYFKSLQLKEQLKNNNDIARALNNIGTAYRYKNKNKEALQFFEKALTIFEKEKNTKQMALILNNIAKVYEKQNLLNKALLSYQKSYKLKLKNDHVIELNSTYLNLSKIHLLLNNVDSASYFADKGEMSILKTNRIWEMQDVYKLKYEIYKAKNNTPQALSYYEKYITTRDSISNDKSRKASMKALIQYDYDKQTIADSIAFAKQTQIKNAELKQQQAELKTKRNQQYGLFGGLALVLVFSGFIYNRFKITQKQKHIIELKEQEAQQQNVIITEQKKLVEHKHQEITESVDYAERIQQGYLVSHEFLNQELKTGFVLFKPKDKVSGDFYWAEKEIIVDTERSRSATPLEILNEQESGLPLREPQCPPQSKIYVCVADSTGHGVPGAFMSMLNMSFLSEATQSRQYSNTADILNFARQMLIKGIKPNAKGEGGNDGMDCVLFSINYDTLELEFTGANNSLWIVRCGFDSAQPSASIEENRSLSGVEVPIYELIELKGDKMPVGRSMKSDTSFTSQIFQLQKGDWIYASTDGFPDQFGGEKGKKYMSKNLKETLLSICHLHEDEQKHQLETIFESWKGELEQVDDVTVMGIRI